MLPTACRVVQLESHVDNNSMKSEMLVREEERAPKDTAYNRWTCYSG